MSLFKPCISAAGPKDAKLAFVGEAPGEDEETTGIPLIGRAGQELRSMCQEVGLNLSSAYKTNVLFTRPPGNKLKEFLVEKKALPPGYSLPALQPGLYLHPDLVCEVERLKAELSAGRHNLCVALGNTALWALTGSSRISSARGTISVSSLTPGLKVLPTYHPASLFHGSWQNRVVILQDLLKAKREQEFPEVRRPVRRFTIDPTIDELRSFVGEALEARVLSCDIETEKRQITAIGFSTRIDRSFVVPFWDKRKAGYSYWSPSDEVFAWELVEEILSRHPCVLFQNGLYDLQYILRMGITVSGALEDTMLRHHAMFPELQKSLGFLGSIYTNELSWKKMRKESEVNKRDA